MMLARALLLIVSGTQVPGDEPTITLADLVDYRAALEAAPSEMAEAVPFRALWERPEEHRGRHVRVDGRVVRRFQQPSVGTFPPLTELWVVTPDRDPFCLVFPTPDEAAGTRNALGPGTAIRFHGTFLKAIRYAAADEARVAPLIVGPNTPERLEEGPSGESGSASSFVVLNWVVGLVVGGLVVLLFLRQVAARPARSSGRSSDTSPRFLDAPSSEAPSDAEKPA